MNNEIKNKNQAIDYIKQVAKYIKREHGNHELYKKASDCAEYLQQLEEAKSKYGK